MLVRALNGDGIVHNVQLGSQATARYKYLQWFPSRRNHHTANGDESQNRIPTGQRLLVATEDDVHVYDMRDLQWHAQISGASSNTGKIADISFGWTHDEIMIFSDFGLKMTLWSLRTSRGVEIRDPKTSSSCHSLRPGSGHLAVVTRPTTRDMVMVLTPFTHELEKSFTLATIDAQGLKWSPDGKWLVAWDAASMGYALYVYTPDGQLFKTYNGFQNLENPEFGISTVEWDLSGRYLAMGSYENRITLLHNQTVRGPYPFGCAN